MSTETKTPPVEKIRRKSISASIWRNEGKNGAFYNVTFERSFKDGDDYKNSHSYGQDDVLVLGQLTSLVWEKINELQAADRAAASSN